MIYIATRSRPCEAGRSETCRLSADNCSLTQLSADNLSNESHETAMPRRHKGGFC